jgi:hypothetical protein
MTAITAAERILLDLGITDPKEIDLDTPQSATAGRPQSD